LSHWTVVETIQHLSTINQPSTLDQLMRGMFFAGDLVYATTMSAPSSKLRWLMSIVSVGCALCVLHWAGANYSTVCKADTSANGDPDAAEPVISPEHADKQVSPDPSGERPQEPDRNAKRRAASIGLLGLVGIVLTGVGLMVLVVLWGHRLRRITRSSSPHPTRGDELWYLRPDKQKPAESSNPPDENDSSTLH
jgi:hypothetical protein